MRQWVRGAWQQWRMTVDRALHHFQAGLLVRKPLMLARMSQVVLTHALTSRTRVWDFAISVTPECNLHCEHCFDRAFVRGAAADAGKRLLSTAELTAVIREQLALGVVHFSFQGGEVFFRDDLEQLIKACEPHRSYISVVTNGILFSEETAARLRGWGVDSVVISIDSGLPQEHDAFRQREGTWEAATQAVERARRHGFVVTIATTVSHQSLRSEGFRLVREYARQRGLRHYIFIAIPVGAWANRQEVLIDAADRALLDEANRAAGTQIRRDVHPHIFRRGCPAVKEGVYLTAYGDVLPCPFLHTSLGNVRDHTSGDILRRAMEEVEAFRVHQPLCLIAEDREFIAAYGQQTFEAPAAPLDGAQVYGFKRHLPPRPAPLGQ